MVTLQRPSLFSALICCVIRLVLPAKVLNGWSLSETDALIILKLRFNKTLKCTSSMSDWSP